MSDRYGRPALVPPLSEVIGTSVDTAAEVYRSQGLTVEVIDLQISDEVTQEMGLLRVRLYARDGLIERATRRGATGRGCRHDHRLRATDTRRSSPSAL
jgi:hypothetical protein